MMIAKHKKYSTSRRLAPFHVQPNRPTHTPLALALGAIVFFAIGAYLTIAIKLHNKTSDHLNENLNNIQNSHWYLPPPHHRVTQLLANGHYPDKDERPVNYITVGQSFQVEDPKHPATASWNDAFSATWWTVVSNFLKVEKFESVSQTPEDGVFELLRVNGKNTVMTTDWLDFSVEHMSKWWKALDFPHVHSQQAVNKVINTLTNYVTSRKMMNAQTKVPQETLVVVAYMPSKTSYKSEEITKWSLVATLSSFIAVGMGRIVVSGRLPEEEELIVDAFDIVKKQFQLNGPTPTTELSFCLAMDEAYNDAGTRFNIPVSALKKLRHVLLGDASEGDIQCWLGGGTTTMSIKKEDAVNKLEPIVQSKWKYIALTEPDTLLTIRPSSLEALGKKLKEGYILAPHRLQPIPHGSDFKGLGIEKDKYHLIPAAGYFEHVHALSSNEMSCCDAGPFKPVFVEKTIHDFGTQWWMQGFWEITKNNPNETMSVEYAHKLLLPYPLIRLVDGTAVTFCGANSGRMCRPGIGDCE